MNASSNLEKTVQNEVPEDHPVLYTDNLTKTFGSLHAVDNVTISVDENEFRSVIGPNGAGKTTFFNLIAGTLSPTAGEIIFDGRDITGTSEHARSQQGISRTFQITQLFPDMSVQENLEIAAQSIQQDFNPLHTVTSEVRKKASDMLESLSIEGQADTISRTLSHGDKKKLEIGMSLVTDPRLLLLDEPTSGVSGQDSHEIMGIIDELTEGVTVVLIEHDVDIVLDYSDSITVLNQGSVVTHDTPDNIVNNEQVQKVYLGGYE